MVLMVNREFTMTKYDLSLENLIVRHDNGVKLERPNKKIKITSKVVSLNCMQDKPFSFYFEDTETKTKECNEITAIECGFDSKGSFLNQPWYKYFTKATIKEPLQNCKEILNTNNAKITYENSLRKDGTTNDTLSIRMPWYDSDNKIIGLFGCSIVMGVTPLTESLTQIAELGFLDFKYLNKTKSLVGREIDNMYFSRRELDCLKLTIRGKTAKQVASILNLSVYTIHDYIENLKIKLNVSSKSELIDKAFDYFI